MMKLKQEETVLIGNWKYTDGEIEGDAVYKRIEWLISEYLIEIGADESGWCKLYQDPDDKRYWELTYPDSEQHGGGPPQIKNISSVEAKSKYKFI